MNSLTFQNWDEYTLESNDGFLNTTNYQSTGSSTDKRKQLQSQISQTRDYLNNTVKTSVDTLEAHSIVSADTNLTVTTANNVTTLKVNVSSSGEATKSYVDAQDTSMLNSAKSYADTQDTATLNSAKAYTDSHAINPYPVGAIYLSVVSTSPSTLFGGTWVQIQDTFLLACGTTYAAGATGGEAAHTLTISEIPSHTHNYRRLNETTFQASSGDKTIQDNEGWADTYTTAATGGGLSHNNMPPYLAIYMWKRTA